MVDHVANETHKSLHSLTGGTDKGSLVSALVKESLRYQSEEYRWSWKYLKSEFSTKKLDDIFTKYDRRIRHANFVMVIILSIVHSSMQVARALSSELVFSFSTIYSPIACAVSYVALLIATYNKYFFTKSKIVPLVASIFLLTLLIGEEYVSVVLDCQFGSVCKYSQPRLGSTAYLILLVHFLPMFRSKIVAILVGLLVTVCDLMVNMHQVNTTFDSLIGDLVTFIILNVLGVMKQFLDDLSQRKVFLDYRSCIDSKLKLQHEKEQEEKLLLAIIPKHICADVRAAIRQKLDEAEKLGVVITSSKTKTFNEMFVKSYQDVSILFADIVSFTPLTTELEVSDLVETINELFSRFDEATENNHCLRIKLLGDCYYCVSGIPELNPSSPSPESGNDEKINDVVAISMTTISSNDDNGNKTQAAHALNCVNTGFAVIEIIRDVNASLRQKHGDRGSINIGMRIGVHTGDVHCGILGSIKWQYDIWSRDVTIANILEQTGTPGRVHISKATKDKLGEGTFEYEPVFMQHKYLDELGIETYLVVPPDNHPAPPPTEPPFQTVNDHVTFAPIDEVANDNRGYELDEIHVDGIGEIVDDYPDGGGGRKMAGAAGRRFSVRDTKHFSNRAGLPPTMQRASSARPNIEFDPRSSLGMKILIEKSVESFNKLKDEKNVHFEKAIDNMALSKREQWLKPTGLHPLFLTFRNIKREIPFLKQTDPVFKHSLLCNFVVFLAIIFIIFWDFQFKKSRHELIAGCSVIISFLVLINYISWHNFVTRKFKRRDSLDSIQDEDDEHSEAGSAIYTRVPSCIGSCLSLASSWLPKRFISRTLAFALTSFSFVAWLTIASIRGVAEENPASSNSSDPNTFTVSPSVNPSEMLPYDRRVIQPRMVTYCFALTMVASSFFVRTHYLFKLVVKVTSLAIFSYLADVTWKKEPLLWESRFAHSLQTENWTFAYKDHILFLTFVLILLHLEDRQVEYFSRLSYLWKARVIDEEVELTRTRAVNKSLLLNILPEHLAARYIKRDYIRRGELYYEKYSQVAVMFASIPNFMEFFMENDIFQKGLRCLTALNVIIYDFDKLVTKDNRFKRIEKMKVIGSTYMAAAGLEPGIKLQEEEDGARNLVLLVEFATAMMQQLEIYNKHSFQDFTLRIGIDCGVVLAGVVGAQKPMYDIWGDSVNMASRMDSTGLSGRIQVTEQCANILMEEGYDCEARGQVYVKGKGMVNTYFVVTPYDKQDEVTKL